MLRTLTYRILSATDGQTILHYLKSLGYSGPILVHLKKTDHGTLLNGVWAHMNETLHTGDLLCLHLEENTSGTSIFPQQIPLAICYEDEDLLVIDKPAGMPVHPSAAHQRDTLANAVTGYYRAKGEIRPFRCINRLDRDTTGVLVLAKNPLSGALLSAQMKQRQIRRTYLALTDGIPPERGTISAPVARMDASVITREVNFERGETAVTHYERLAVSNGYALVELHLDTGRTHQIRVHMKYIGCPLPGDFLYHPVFDRIGRQALHSFQLEFAHPITGEPMCFLAPVPEDFRRAFAQ